VNSMSDVFHAHFTLDMIRQVFAVMTAAHWHQFQVLTKRPERALRYADRLPWPDNLWMGTSVESLAVARRVDTLRKIPAKVRFLSAEPLLGPLDGLDLIGIHWVIGGGESGLGARPCSPVWARALRDLCQREGVAFFWKQWGGRTSKSGGRVLDGREWSEYPIALGNARARANAVSGRRDPQAAISSRAERNRSRSVRVDGRAAAEP
jgi:protein gp37